MIGLWYNVNMVKRRKPILSTDYPLIAAEWDVGANKTIDPNASPQNISSSSRIHYWWHCSHGHPSWPATPAYRTRFQQYGCPYCEGRKAIPGETDLATLFPELAKEYADDLNDTPVSTIKPEDKHNYWWRCSLGHTWQASPNTRTKKHTHCRYCANRYAWPGFNDLASKFPDIAAEFDTEKNDTTADHVMYNSHHVMWWKCDKGHSWSDEVRARTERHTRCPKCYGVYKGYGNRLIPGVNDLFTIHPELRGYWDEPTYDNPLPKSNKKYHWKCDLGHTWFESPNALLHRKSGICPFCANTAVLPGFNDLATLNPVVAKDWDYLRNGELKPTRVAISSNRKVWWHCAKGHVWSASVYSRTGSIPTGCPECAAAETSSRGEIEMRDYITSLLPTGTEVLANDRTVIAPKELDVYVPSLAIAVEHDGLYWHSDAVISSHDYHHDKWDRCHCKGIRLIQIWEDEWHDKRPMIEDILIRALNPDQLLPSDMSVCVVDERLPVDETNEFLDRNDIHGRVMASTRLGIRDDNGDLLAVMLMSRRDDGVYLLTRYSIKIGVRVDGGFDRLLAYFRNQVGIHGEVVAFSDHRLSDEAMYVGNGFSRTGFIDPDYRYVSSHGNLARAFNHRREMERYGSQLRTKTGLKDEQLEFINGLERVYDSGKTRWLLDW